MSIITNLKKKMPVWLVGGGTVATVSVISLLSQMGDVLRGHPCHTFRLPEKLKRKKEEEEKE